ncbi:MAG: transposase, partial [Thermoleophilaceae bacterium]|nr:transposase [Thermoleophilaceae bacterium]
MATRLPHLGVAKERQIWHLATDGCGFRDGFDAVVLPRCGMRSASWSVAWLRYAVHWREIPHLGPRCGIIFSQGGEFRALKHLVVCMPNQPPTSHEDLTPSQRYLRKDYTPGSTFHVYNRGRNRQVIFVDDNDRRMFLDCIGRYLRTPGDVDSRGRAIKCFAPDAAVIAFCLRGNHYHLIIHQRSQYALRDLMRRAMIAYGSYFNKRHDRNGRLFVERFKAVKVDSRPQLARTITYIHLNPARPFDDPWTSHYLYMSSLDQRTEHWCAADQGIKAFGGRGAYLEAMHVGYAKRVAQT